MKKEKKRNIVTYQEVRENCKKKGVTEEMYKKFLIEQKTPLETVDRIVQIIYHPTEKDFENDEITKTYLESFNSESSSKLSS